MGGTWGISSGTFLYMYAVALAAVWLGIRFVRWRLAGSPRRSPPPHLDPYEVAMLNGGDDLVATAVLTRLRISEIIDAGDSSLRDAFKADELRSRRAETSPALLALETSAPLHPVEAAALEAVQVAAGQPAAAVRNELTAMPALGALRQRLEDLHLLYSDDIQQTMRQQWVWYLPFISVGAARFVVGANGGNPVSNLFALLAGTVYLMVRDTRPTGRTSAGSRTLKALRGRNKNLPAQASAGALRSDHLVLAISLFGPSVLWDTDPWLAVALDTPGYGSNERLVSGGGGCGGGGGGCGGGGGGGGGGCGG